jgi:hypothetical protein
MAAGERSMGTVMELVVEPFVVDPKPLRPDDADIELFFLVFVFLAPRLVEDEQWA